MPVGQIRMRLQIEGQQVLDRSIHGLIDRLDDLSGFWDQVVELWSDYETRLFAAEGAVDGAPRWAALSAGYAAWKAEHFPDAPILERTGEMRQAAIDPTVEKDAGSLTLTVESPYLMYHQSIRPRTKLPRRPVADLSAKFKTTLTGALRRWLWDE